MFGFLKKKAGESVQKFSGQTDFLEGVCGYRLAKGQQK